MQNLMNICWFLLMLMSGVLSRSSRCPPQAHRQKTLNMGIYYTDTFLRLWQDSSGNIELLDSIQNLIGESNRYLTRASLGNGNSLTVKVDPKNVEMIRASTLGDILNEEDARTAASKFCKVAHGIKKSNHHTWDYVYLFVTENEFVAENVTGIVTGLGGVCESNKERNCGILKDSTYRADTFLMLNKTFVHEIAHSLGVFHDYECKPEHSYGGPCPSLDIPYIMTSPGSDDVHFSALSKRIINSRFSDKSEFKCLKWSCGSPKVDRDMLSNEADKEVLKQMCNKWYKGFTFYDKRLKDSEHEAYKPYVTEGKVNFYSVLVNNRYWYKRENVCKGVPCVRVHDKGMSISAIREDVMSYYKYPCGKNMHCEDGACVNDE